MSSPTPIALPPVQGPRRVNHDDQDQLRAHPVKLRRIGSLFRPHLRALLGVVVLIIASGLINLSQPFLVKGVIDDALPHGNTRMLVWLVIAMIVVAILTAVVGVIQTLISTRVGQRVMHALRTDLFKHLQSQSLGFFTRTHGGEVHSRMTNDINGMQTLVTNTATGVASNLTTAIGTIVAMLALSPWLSLISLLVIPPAVLVARRVALLRRDVTAKQQAQMAVLQNGVDEGLSVSGIRLAKTMGTTKRDAARFDEASADLAELEVQSQLAGRWRMSTMQIIFAAIPALIYLAAGFPVGGGMSIGTVVAFTALQANLFRPVLGLMSVGVQWVTAMAFFSRIFEWLDLVPEIREPEHPVKVDLDRARGEVRFEGVGFEYPDSGGATLTDVDVLVPAGTSTAVVGPTGSGKSTLVSLVSRLNEATSGRVTIDGVDVRDMASADLASLVGEVSQETYLMHATVAENLRLAAPEATDQQLWEALTTAQLAARVSELPQGLDTVVGARGHRFSGGEQQRLAIARTLLHDPKVLVLDEATSALDNTTEAAVQHALDRLAKGRTTITIAHRLSTIEDADQVLVLDGGRIVERGSAPDLRAAGGAFARLSRNAAVGH